MLASSNLAVRRAVSRSATTTASSRMSAPAASSSTAVAAARQRRAVASSTPRPSYHPPSSEPFSPPPTPSSSPADAAPAPVPARTKVTLATLLDYHRRKVPITMMTAYDYPTALLLAAHAELDMVLVGDSLAQVALGHRTTTSLTLDDVVHHARAVSRALPPHAGPCLVADLPFGSYEVSVEQGVASAVRLVQAAAVDMVKVEGGPELVPLVRRLAQVGIPVMPHIGLTPQRAVALSGYKVQGRTAPAALALVDLARALQDAGASAVLLEAIPSHLAAHITSQLAIPTIGIGAGPSTSGQVLVLSDALGVFPPGHAGQPRFVRRFAEAGREMRRGLDEYVRAVKGGDFPHPEREGYKMAKGEWDKFVAAQQAQEQQTPAPPTGDEIP